MATDWPTSTLMRLYAFIALMENWRPSLPFPRSPDSAVFELKVNVSPSLRRSLELVRHGLTVVFLFLNLAYLNTSRMTRQLSKVSHLNVLPPMENCSPTATKDFGTQWILCATSNFWSRSGQPARHHGQPYE